MSLGFEKRVKECFESLFACSHPDKKEKTRGALTGIYRFIHLGPYEQANQPDSGGEPIVSLREARFALTMAQTIFEYITPGASGEKQQALARDGWTPGMRNGPPNGHFRA
ncbi:MAG TPA: hypothetical protein VJK29_05315 [Terriglobales bacterium]|nr:hypothetical protein [Terriglobales bacterium]